MCAFMKGLNMIVWWLFYNSVEVIALNFVLEKDFQKKFLRECDSKLLALIIPMSRTPFDCMVISVTGEASV